MADIIERNATCARQLLECAAEIERLRAALQYAVERFATAQLHDDAEACRRMINEQKGDQG